MDILVSKRDASNWKMWGTKKIMEKNNHSEKKKRKKNKELKTPKDDARMIKKRLKTIEWIATCHLQ